MTDIVDQKTRSRMMASVRSRNTKPEVALRRALHARGFRFRLHGNALKGRPDLVLPKYKAVVLVHGCFWHRHFRCRYSTTPSTSVEFWNAKFEANTVRDAAVRATLIDAGWRVGTLWECALRKPASVDTAADLISNWLRSGKLECEVGEKDVLAETAKG